MVLLVGDRSGLLEAVRDEAVRHEGLVPGGAVPLVGIGSGKGRNKALDEAPESGLDGMVHVVTDLSGDFVRFPFHSPGIAEGFQGGVQLVGRNGIFREDLTESEMEGTAAGGVGEVSGFSGPHLSGVSGDGDGFRAGVGGLDCFEDVVLGFMRHLEDPDVRAAGKESRSTFLAGGEDDLLLFHDFF